MRKGNVRRIHAEDLAHVLISAGPDFDALRGARTLITGASGFVGSWLVETAAFAIAEAGADLQIFALVPPDSAADVDAERVARLVGVQVIRGDIRSLDHKSIVRQYPAVRTVDYVVHAAIHVNAETILTDPFPTLDTAVEGTRRLLTFAHDAGARRLLFLSSGAVYGPQPPDLPLIPESYLGGPDSTDTRSVYAESKRIGETMCACATRALGLEAVIARAFAFVGPHLPINRHFAIGNFIRDAIAGGPVVVLGDGTAVRSYQYAADMAVWLWALLVRGVSGRAYNVGASHEVSVGDVANLVRDIARCAGTVEVRKRPTPGAQIDRYVPDVRRVKNEIGVQETIALEDAIERTLRWHRYQR